MRSLTSLAAVALLATTFAACAPADEATDDTDSTTSDEPSAAEDCTPDTMETIADGTLTIATDDPAYAPWFVDNDPTNGEGYEAAVGYAIAEQLGYSDDQVTWVKVPFNKVVQPGPQGLRLRPQPGLDHRGPAQGGRLLLRLLRRGPDGHHQRRQRHRRGHLGRRAGRRQARCPGRHDQLHRDHRPDPAVRGPRRLRHQRPGRPGAPERPDRRHRRRPAHGLLHDGRPARRRRDRRPAAARRRRARAVRRSPRQGQRR